MSIFGDFFKKEAPLLGLQGSGGGLGFLAGRGGGGTFTIYLWGASADNTNNTIKSGFTEVTIKKSSIPSSYSRFEVIVGQEGLNGNSTAQRFGGGGGGKPGSAPNIGSPGGGGSFVFLSSPSSTSVFASNGLSIQVPVASADGRCVAAAGGSGGRDIADNTAAPGGGGLIVPNISAGDFFQTAVDRRNSGPAYIGANGNNGGSDWSSGGGGGGFGGGNTAYDYSGYGGSGFAGQNTVSPQPFTGTSPVNGLTYMLGNTFGPNPSSPYAYTTPAGAAPYRPSNAGYPIDAGLPAEDTRGYIVIVDDVTGTATQFGYTGTIQYYNFP